MINYPTDRLIYWLNSNSEELKKSVDNYFNDLATDEDIPILRDYLKHWVSYPLHQFEDEECRTILLKRLDNAQTIEDINKLSHDLLDFGIDPF